MSFPNYIGGHKRLWTMEKVLQALTTAADDIRGQVPCCDAGYNKLKKGRLDWPTSKRILEYFGSMARAWIAAGAPAERITLKNIDWTDEEDKYLKNFAGWYTLKQIGKHLRRSAAACKRRLYEKGITARGNQGFFSAAELSQEYDCSCHRIRNLLKSRIIPGKFDKKRNRWQIDLAKISPEMEDLLRAPKRTHKTCLTDKGDYYRRYNLKRILIDGKLTRIEI